jgi:SAM-dependent methyltransferase
VATADARTGQHLRVSTVGDPLRLVDLGCGNAYLTFGAYAHMAVNKKEAMRVVGVDVKRQARETNARVASELGWDDACRFVEGTIRDAVVAFDAGERRSSGGAVEGADGTGDVEDDVAKPEVDIVLALHACDVATDEAIARAVRWNAPLTLVSPCCHHDLQVRLRDAKIQPFPPLSRHGILRERLGDIITDAFRAHVLRLLGHRVSVEEWIGGEHTARNVMIKAVRTGVGADRATWEEYDDMCAQWGVTPRLAEMLEGELAAARAEAFRE